MGYIGSKPSNNFITTDSQRVTSSTNNYVDLDNSISSLNDVIVWVNSVKQESNNLTLTTSTRITLGDTLTASDVVEIAYLGKAVATQTPDTGTVTLDMLSATGTKDATTFLRGDNTFATAGADADNYFATSGLSSKDLGVGLHIKTADSGASVDGNADELVIEGSGQSGITIASGNSDKGNIFFADSGSTARGKVIYNHSSNHLRFDTNGSEKMRISNDGRISINTTDPLGSYLCLTGNSSGDWLVKLKANNNTHQTHYMMVFTNLSDTTIGSITTNNNNTTSYNSGSDYRLKENVNYNFDAITRLKDLKPARFNWISDETNTLVDGFIAHEVTPVVPEAITGEKDAVKEDGTIIPQAIDQAKLVPLLTKALQEAITKIETLEARVQTLEEA